MRVAASLLLVSWVLGGEALQLHRRHVVARRASLVVNSADGGSSRREAVGIVSSGLAVAALAVPGRSTAKCTDIESCREEGERRAAIAEAAAGPIVNVGQGVRYREIKKGKGGDVLQQGDVCDITYEVTTTTGNYMWSYGRDRLGDAVGNVLRVEIGKHDLPVAVELAMVGMTRGAIRRVEMPPNVGFSSSTGKALPAENDFSGKKKFERYNALLTGNGLQPGYAAELLFEVELLKIRGPKERKA